MALKSRKRELDAEKRLFENKVKRAKGREARTQRASSRRQESDIDSGPLRTTTSTCTESESSSTSRSVTPVHSKITSFTQRSPTSPMGGTATDQHSPSLPQLGSQSKPIECGFTSESNDPFSSEQSIPKPRVLQADI